MGTTWSPVETGKPVYVPSMPGDIAILSMATFCADAGAAIRASTARISVHDANGRKCIID